MRSTSVGPLLATILSFYSGLIFIYVLMSWIPSNDGVVGEIRSVLATICEPYVGLFRRILPMAVVGGAGLDFSPLVALLVLQLVAGFVRRF
jgi:YggT family protein